MRSLPGGRHLPHQRLLGKLAAGGCPLAHLRCLLAHCVPAGRSQRPTLVTQERHAVVLLRTGVWVPAQYYEWMKIFSWMQLDIFAIAPAACIGNYTTQLTFVAILPLSIMLVLLILSMAYKTTRDALNPASGELTPGRDPREPPKSFSLYRSLKRGFALGVPPCIIIAFCMLPTVSSNLFATFDCETFSADDASGASQSFMVPDMSIRCSGAGYDNPVYNEARTTALGLIVLWPLAMPLATLLLMLYTRDALLAKRATLVTRATQFLTREYKPSCYWWEVIEMIRRLSLTSVVLLIVPQESELMRLVFAMVITLISLCAVALIAPYRRTDNNTLAIIAQLMLLFVLLVSMIIKLYKDFEDTSLSPATISRIMGFNSPFGFSIVIFGTCCVMALLTLSFMLYQARVFIQTRRKQMSDAIGGLTRFKYSLNLISLAKFRAAGKLAKHEEMRDNGALTVFDLWEDALTFSQSGKIIIFFSHQACAPARTAPGGGGGR